MRALLAVDTFAAAHALDRGAGQRLAIIVEELVTNVICHAGHARDIALTLTLEPGASAPVITLEDDSDPFDPRAGCVSELPNAVRGGGVGLALVAAWSEILAYDRVGGINRLILRLTSPAEC